MRLRRSFIRRKTSERNCKYCNGKFDFYGGRQIYCTPECWHEQYKIAKEKNRPKKSLNEKRLEVPRNGWYEVDEKNGWRKRYACSKKEYFIPQKPKICLLQDCNNEVTNRQINAKYCCKEHMRYGVAKASAEKNRVTRNIRARAHKKIYGGFPIKYKAFYEASKLIRQLQKETA